MSGVEDPGQGATDGLAVDSGLDQKSHPLALYPTSPPLWPGLLQNDGKQPLVVSCGDYELLCPTFHKAILFLFFFLEDVLGYVTSFASWGLGLGGNISHLTYFLWSATACACVLAKV